MPLSSGARLGSYEVTGAIGAGGMGEVYRATDTKLDRQVAIKVLPATLAQDAERLARFDREAKLLASLNHSNIAHVYGFEAATLPDASTVHFLAMELVEGEDLSERLGRGAIPVDESIAIAKQIAEGLEEAHEHGIIHRDLKPANIKVTPDGKVKILDFGLAKAMDPAGASSSNPNVSHSPTLTHQGTSAGMILGTAAYMSPEQARGKAVDKRADIWSFGVVLFEMLTATRLFAGETISDTLAAVLTRDLSLDRVPGTTPDVIRLLIGRCLERDPKKRLRDIGEARLALDSAPAARVRLSAGPFWRERWAAPTMGVAMVAVALATFAWLKGSATPTVLNGPVIDTSLDPGGPVHVLNELGLALSPAGDRLAFVGRDDNGVTSLWLRDLTGGQATPVLGTSRARWPFWSPDGKQLGFAADGRLHTVDLVSGQTTALCLTNADEPAGSWSPKGAIIFPHEGVIYRTDPRGSSCLPATVREEDHPHSEPMFFPDGQRFTFLRGPGFEVRVGNLVDGSHQKWIDDAAGAQVVAPDWVLFSRNPVTTVLQSSPPLLAQRFDPGSLRLTGAPMALLPEIFTPNGRPSYTAASNGVLVAVVENPSYNPLVWIDRAGNTLDSVSSHGAWTIRLSPDDRSIAMGGFGLWIHNRERGTATALAVTSPQRTITLHPSWSHDQRSIAFVAFYPKSSQLQIHHLADGGKTELFDSDREMVGTAWSSRDDAIVFWLYPGGKAKDSEVWQYSLKDKQARRLFATTPEQHNGDCFSCLEVSPNGQWLLYWIPVDGVPDVYIRRYPEIGPPIKVSSQGGYFGVWSADGRAVYYVAPSGNVMAVEVGEHPSQDSLGAPRLVAPAGVGSGLYGVTRDGARFLRRQGHLLSQPMRLIVNWQKRASAGGDMPAPGR